MFPKIRLIFMYMGKNDGKLVQIYIIENDGGFIKIGVSGDVDSRFASLGGSNGGGHKIVRSWVSPYTYLYSIERALHTHYAKNRVEGTEWFEDLDFDEVCALAKEIFESMEHQRLNEIRKRYYKERLGLHVDAKA